MKKIIITLGIIIFGSTVLATPTSDIIPNDQPVVVTREQQDEEVQKEEDIKQTDNETKDSLKNKTTEQLEKDTAKKDNAEITKTKQKKPQYAGLKIYPPKKKKTKKASCDNTPENPCHAGGGCSCSVTTHRGTIYFTNLSEKCKSICEKQKRK